MSKISPEHLARGAFVYVRQSTADQLRNNHESRRRQYALAERAQMLGWSEVVVIDDDLGVWRQLLFPVTTIKSAAPYTAAGSSAARVFDFAPAALAR